MGSEESEIDATFHSSYSPLMQNKCQYSPHWLEAVVYLRHAITVSKPANCCQPSANLDESTPPARNRYFTVNGADAVTFSHSISSFPFAPLASDTVILRVST